jgi:hypothetical protein
MMTLIEYHMVMGALVFVAFVVDNDDDENDLVQILFQLIHEYANLKIKIFNKNFQLFKIILTMPFAICSTSCFNKTFI